MTAWRKGAREMGELIVRRNRGMTVARYEKTGKAEKQAGTSQAPKTAAANRAPATVSDTLRELMTRVTQLGRQAREGRRTLQSGEAALAEVEDNLERMEGLARESAGGGAVDRAALQSSLERLRGEIDRIARDGVEAGLFQDGDEGEGLEALIDAVMDGLSARQEQAQSLPGWLLNGIADAPDRAALLAALGVDGDASISDLLTALGQLPLESDSASGYLAALYLGTVIAGGRPSGTIDPELAAEGLRLLLDAVADGVSPDEAIERLTGGMFISMADFEAQFTAGTAPGLQPFLMDLLLSEDGEAALTSMLALMADGGGGNLDVLMELMTALGGSGGGLMELLDGAGMQESTEGALPQQETLELGTLQLTGRDVSGVSADPETGTVTVAGTESLILRSLGQEQETAAVRLTGSATVTLQQVNVPVLTAESPQVRLLSAGESALLRLQLGEGTTLTIDGGGLLRIGTLEGGASSVLRLAGGAVALTDAQAGNLAAPVMVDGPVSLLAAEGITVVNAQGKPLEPFDIVWKLLLPDWSSITSLAVDGKQGPLTLMRDNQEDPVRLWLLKQDSDQKYPAHTLALRGRDKAGRLKTRYVYVRWDERGKTFQEISMYPNPFTVTGGEQGVDWRYEEESHTLYILSSQVTAIAGGTGTDGNELPFSGRIVLSDGIGRVSLTLDGVECRVPTGKAFDLGRGNDVTLLLQRGTDNVFESGAGCAGISMGDGTSLLIDQAKGARGAPDGTLTATGGSGGAGIGRDSGTVREPTGPIRIQGGTVTAVGAGGGAGIGGALGAPVGDIRIQGGTVSAQAGCCAAAIGAGIQGACGDIVITGSAKVVKAQGGGPDGDIGGCLFGNCGKVRVSAGTDIGAAKLWTQRGLSMQVGESTVTLPRFRVSTGALHLDELDISTREAAKTAMSVLTSDRRWVTRLQGAYGAMYGQLAQSFGSMYSVNRYFSVVRDTSEASSLVMDIREVLRQSPLAKFLQERGMEDVGQLLR